MKVAMRRGAETEHRVRRFWMIGRLGGWRLAYSLGHEPRDLTAALWVHATR